MNKRLLSYFKKIVFFFVILYLNIGQIFAGEPTLFTEQIEVINFFKAGKAIFSYLGIRIITTFKNDPIAKPKKATIIISIKQP